MIDCKHKFRTISEAKSGWDSKETIFQCDECGKLFTTDRARVKYWEIKLEE